MATLSIYAELLLNIRQITVVASLPSAYNNATLVTLSKDRQSLSVAHDGKNVTVKLPAPVRAGHIPSVAPGSTTALSLRLPIADEVAKTMLSRNQYHEASCPWSASSMAIISQVTCRFCQALLVKEQVQTWKDLPSENWAEMMDFWHCHKPDTHDFSVHKQDGVRKGYGAANSIRPIPTVGLIDITSLLLMQQDCKVMISEDPVTLKNGSRHHVINCASCRHPVGVAVDTDVRIYKWNIRLRSNSCIAWEEYSAQKLISAQLLAMIESQGIQKFVLHGQVGEDNIGGLLIWIFTPNMYFSSTSAPQSPKEVMKIYYKIVQYPEELLAEQSLKMDELQLPNEVLRTLHSEIKSSTQLLPVPARKFQDWDVGLLER
ncbi:MAG: hypothetical protein Q9209_002550 [Squamulea sp. 1 TL-2023]